MSGSIIGAIKGDTKSVDNRKFVGAWGEDVGAWRTGLMHVDISVRIPEVA